jgi:hypothetical protein
MQQIAGTHIAVHEAFPLQHKESIEMKYARKAALAGALALTVSAVQAGAQTYTGSFGGSSFTQYTSSPFTSTTSTAFTYRQGEYYQQSWASTGLTSAQSLGLTLNIEGNPYGGNQIFTAFLNNTSVGTYAVSTQQGPTNFFFNFAPVGATGTSGTDFVLRLQQTGPTLASGTGSSAFLFAGSSAILSQNATTTPEPASTTLLATGLLGLAPLVRRRLTRS